MFQKSLTCIFLVFLASCKTIAPKAPQEKYSEYSFAPEVSDIILPVEISLPGLQNTINKNISGLIYEDNDLHDGDDLMLKVWKQDDIKISASGNEIFYQIPLKIWLKTGTTIKPLGVNLSYYDDAELAISLKFKTRFNIDKNWNAETQTDPDGYDWISKPDWRVAGVKMPITPIADRIVKNQMKSFAKMIDDEVKKNINVRQEVEKAWKMLQKPVLINGNPDVWLKITPLEFSLSPIKGSSEKVSTNLGLKANIETFVGSKPKLEYNGVLPELLPARNGGSYFTIALTNDILYEDAAELARQNLVGKVFEFGKKGQKKIKVDDVDVYGNIDKLIIKLNISGHLNGALFLSGNPYYDASSGKVKFKNLDYDLDTKNKLVSSADWLAHGVFLKKISPFLEYDLKKEIQGSKDMMQAFLNDYKLGDGIVLNGELSELEPYKIVLTHNSLKAVINAKGKMEVKISEL